MKWIRRYKFGILFLMVLAMAMEGKAGGVGNLGVGISSSPTVGQVGSNLTFTVSVTNLTGLGLSSFTITNALPSSFQFPFQPDSGWVTNGIGNEILFFTNTFPVGSFFITHFSVVPSAAGPFTSTLIFSSSTVGGSTLLTTNVTTSVGTGAADLGVFLSVGSTPVIAGDQANYSIILTNAGAIGVGNFFVTNTLPSSLKFVSVTPTGATTNSAGFVLSVPSLNAASSTTYNVTVLTTTAGAQTIAATINAPNLTDTNLANNSASTNLPVTAPNTNQVVTTVSSPVFNPQTGLFNETVSLVNTSDVALASVRLVVGGLLATNKLYNSVGTNNGNPFVVYPASISSGQTVEFLLEFFYPLRVPQTNLTYTTFGVPKPNLNATNSSGSGLVLRIEQLEGDRLLIEFPSTRGKTYRIIYSDHSDFTSPLMAEPSIVAPADRTQWIDEGPPKTISKPGNSTSRFYKVFAQ